MSSIVTFYSYKGGVGRSMALSNIAVLLVRRGLKVLAVDWDLEAPGLERYFSYFVSSKTGTGLLRMLVDAREKRLANFDAYTSSIDCGGSHSLTLLASGREQDDSYSSNLETFDWSEFFAGGGGAFFERLREEWRSAFDIVLIDSRTGLSDTGGICTIQLPDAVVAMFTANYQSLYGVRDVIRLAQRARQSLAYDRMPLSVLPLPSRWGVQEFQETQVWLDRVVDGVQEFYSDWLPRSINPREVVEKIKIPHHSYFGFGERLAVAEQGTSDPTGLGFVYDKVAAFLASDFKDLTSLIGEEAGRAAAAAPSALATQPQDSSGYVYDVFVSYDRSSTEAAIEIVDALKYELSMLLAYEPRLFADVSELSVGDDWRFEVRDAAMRSKVMLALITPRYFSSKFAMEELETFRLRGELGHDEAIVLPVILGGDSDQFPESIRNIKWLDLREVPLMAMSKVAPSRRSVKWHHAITRISSDLVRLIARAPARPNTVV